MWTIFCTREGPYFHMLSMSHLFFTIDHCTLIRFALVVIPVYQDSQDQESSPFNLPNSTPFSWSWFSTINRVNSQVQKVILSYQAQYPIHLGSLSDRCIGIRYNSRKISTPNGHTPITGLFSTLLRQRSSRSSLHPSTFKGLGIFCAVFHYDLVY